MIDISYDAATGILRLRPHGPISDADVAGLRRTLTEALAGAAGLKGLLVDAERFPGWQDFAAFAGHMGVIRDFHGRIAKLALVSDAAFATGAELIGRHVLGVDARHFAQADHDAALAWLET